jgi:hypothetical protein
VRVCWRGLHVSICGSCALLRSAPCINARRGRVLVYALHFELELRKRMQKSSAWTREYRGSEKRAAESRYCIGSQCRQTQRTREDA